MYGSSGYFSPLDMFYSDWFIGLVVVGGMMLAVASIFGLIALLVAAIVPWRRGGLPRCGHCGYPVRGVASWSCPECGSDFHDRGIIAPHFAIRVHPLLSVPLWSILLVTPAVVLTMLLTAIGPQVETNTDNIDLKPNQPTGFNEVQLYTYSAPGGPRNEPVRFELQIDTPSAYHYFAIDMKAMTYVEEYGSAGPHRPTPMDRAALDQIFRSVGVDPTQADFGPQADELWQIINDAPIHGIRAVTPTNFSISYTGSWLDQTPALWWLALQAMVWVMVWLVGAALLVVLDLTRRPPRANHRRANAQHWRDTSAPRDSSPPQPTRTEPEKSFQAPP